MYMSTYMYIYIYTHVNVGLFTITTNLHNQNEPNQLGILNCPAKQEQNMRTASFFVPSFAVMRNSNMVVVIPGAEADDRGVEDCLASGHLTLFLLKND